MTSAITPVSTNLFEYAGFDLVSETQNGVTITRPYDSLGRSAGFNMGADYAVTYGYDAFGRFASVSSAVAAASSVANYSYVPGADLVAAMTNSSGFAWSRAYEPERDLIASVENAFGANLISAYGYENDADGRRTLRIDSTPALSVTNTFGYNVRSEVTGAVMHTNEYGYVYDPIGNRLYSAVNAETNTYAANQLNQYSAISNQQSATRVPAYDPDGNMLTNGVWSFAWDGENRMACAVSNGVVMVTNVYDHMSRRIIKIVGDTQHTCTYDNWSTIRETSSSMNGVCTNHYVWGLDLSGSLQGAAGVGGLLVEIKDGVPYCPGFDANCNVTEYVDANGTVVAHREYSAFGETTAFTGALADNFTFWWSTKPWCPVAGLSEYEFRRQDPIAGLWLSRDPIGEPGFELTTKRSKSQAEIERETEAELYALLLRFDPLLTYDLGLRPEQPQNLLYPFVLNDPINQIDPYGLSCFTKCWKKCISDNYGKSFDIALALSYISLVQISQDVYNGVVEAAAKEKLKNLNLSGAFTEGDIVRKMEAAEKAASAAKSLSGWVKVFSFLSKVSGVVSAGATGYVVGATSYCTDNCLTEGE